MLFFLFFFLLDFLHFGGFVLVKAENVIEIAVVDVHLLIFLLYVCSFDQLNVDLRTLFESVVLERPAGYDSEREFIALESDNKVF